MQIFVEIAAVVYIYRRQYTVDKYNFREIKLHKLNKELRELNTIFKIRYASKCVRGYFTIRLSIRFI